MARLCGTSAVVLGGLLVAGLLAGCSSGGGQGGPPPVVTTATVDGVVVDATNPTHGIQGAVVTVTGNGASATSNVGGTFAIAHLPAGTLTLSATFPGLSATFQPVSVSVATKQDQTTSVVIAALPTTQAAGDTVTIGPGSVTLEVGARQTFSVSVRRSGLSIALAPNWAVTGGIGTVSATGAFVATTPGTGRVTVSTGTASAFSVVTVVASLPPQLGTLEVSPASLSSDGGTVRIALSASDGDGVETVTATIELPDGTTIARALAREAGTEFSGTWSTNYVAPANTEPTDAEGGQPAQTYSVMVSAVDGRGDSTQTEWKSVTVAGLEAPPPKPF